MFSKDGPTFFELAHQALSSTRHGYDLLAPKFDVSPFRTPDKLIEPVVRIIGQVDAALDIGCGTGAGMRLLRPLCRERIVGIDFSPGMLEQARRNLEQAEGTARVEFVERNVLQMTFQEEFDVATCFGALGHILPEDQKDFLRGIRAALKPGGRFVFYSAYPPRLFSVSSILSRGFNAAMKVRNALLKPPFIMYYLTFLLPRIGEKLEAEGFTVEIRSDLHRRFRLVLATKT